MPSPSTSASASATKGLPLSARMASDAAVSPRMDPTERSMLPVVITKVIATATTIVGATCRATLTRLPDVRKASVCRLKKTNSTASTADIDSTPKLRCTKSWRAPRRSAPPVVGATVWVLTLSLPHHRGHETAEVGLGGHQLAVVDALVQDDEPVGHLEEVLEAVG